MSKRGRGKKARSKRPKSGYRGYLERCAAVGREPLRFEEYLVAARRWRVNYASAKERGDSTLVRELEELLCERGSGVPLGPESA